MNTSAKGAAFERRVVTDLEHHGWLVTRASNSKGVADVWAVAAADVALIECKTNGALYPEQWNHLFREAMRVGAVPVLAEPVDRRRADHRDGPPIRYWRLLAEKVPGGSLRQPREPWDPTTIGTVAA